MSSIEWTGETWNPIVGCSKISEGCRNCYAINQASRNAAMGANLENPGRLKYYEGLTEKRGDRVEWTGTVNFVPEALEIPLKRRKPTTYFVNSMSDLFHESVTNEQLDRIFAVMALTPQHTYQILTKRPEGMLEYCDELTTKNGGVRFAAAIARLGCDYEFQYHQYYSLINSLKSDGGSCLPLPNVWLGVTVENQKTANDRIPLLLQTPAAIRFLSCEPLLEEIDFLDVSVAVIEDAMFKGGWDCDSRGAWEDYTCLADHIDWIIVGGESGHGARPCSIEWIRSIVRQCKEAEVPVFVKQLGSNPFVQLMPELGGGIPWEKSTGKGGDIEDFPEDLKIRQFPSIAH